MEKKNTRKAKRVERPDLEYPDPTPAHVPGKSDRKAPLSLRDEMQRYIRQQLAIQAQANKQETFEEADDFDVPDIDDDDLATEYTVLETPEGMGYEIVEPEPLPNAEPESAPAPSSAEAEDAASVPETKTVTST